MIKRIYLICEGKKTKLLPNSLPNSSANGAQGLGFNSLKAPDLVVFHHYNSPLFFLPSPWTALAFVSACHSSVNAMKADSRDAQSQKLHYPPLNSTTGSEPLEQHCPQKNTRSKFPPFALISSRTAVHLQILYFKINQ